MMLILSHAFYSKHISFWLQEISQRFQRYYISAGTMLNVLVGSVISRGHHTEILLDELSIIILFSNQMNSPITLSRTREPFMLGRDHMLFPMSYLFIQKKIINRMMKQVLSIPAWQSRQRWKRYLSLCAFLPFQYWYLFHSTWCIWSFLILSEIYVIFSMRHISKWTKLMRTLYCFRTRNG